VAFGSGFGSRFGDCPPHVIDRQLTTDSAAARGLRGEADDIEVGRADEELERHGIAEYPATGRARRAGSERGRPPEHQLCFAPNLRGAVPILAALSRPGIMFVE
jgi:hypothetical protein